MNNIDIIKETIIDLTAKMGFEAEVVVDESDQEDIVVNIQIEEAGYLIGQAGASLQALQHLARVLANKKMNSILSQSERENPSQEQQLAAHFVVDINNYKKHRTELLKEFATSMAEQAIREKQFLFLQPMPAYERRIVHMSLANHPEIDTESTGQEPDRRIIIKPKNK